MARLAARMLASVGMHTRFMFLYVINLFLGCLGRDSGTENRMAWWSETARSVQQRLKGLKPTQHTRSRVCPLACVGPCTCCLISKQSNNERKSTAKEQLLESTWMLKSPSMRVAGDMGQTEASRSENSCRKQEEAFGGR